MNPNTIIVYRSQQEAFWDQAIMNGDAVVYGFWFLVCCAAIVGGVVAYHKVTQLIQRRARSRKRASWGTWS